MDQIRERELFHASDLQFEGEKNDEEPGKSDREDNWDEEDEEDEDGDWDVDWMDETGDFTKKLNAARAQLHQPNAQTHGRQATTANGGVNANAANEILRALVDREHASETQKSRQRTKDRADRATVEQVLDPRTRLILFRLLQRGVLTSMDGCISTGKEANVYHSASQWGSVAVKVYKTSILTFKDRDRYVTGEFRYRRGYCKHNPRKMVATWAEKEMRNLLRMRQAGLRCPCPRLLKGHVVVMDFLGVDGWPSPLLKNAEMSSELADRLYRQIVLDMRKLYRECRLVHADLSEYNLILHREKTSDDDDGTPCLYMIDVSQSVEHDHPHSLDFLRSDCTNVTNYFRAAGAAVMSIRQLFQLIADPGVSDETQIEALLSLRTTDAPAQSEDDALFLGAFIAHKLDHVMHFERDIDARRRGDELNNPFETLISNAHIAASASDGDCGEDENASTVDASDTVTVTSATIANNDIDEKIDMADETVTETKQSIYVRQRNESPNTRKERKRLVKNEQRENRLHKTPKHVKKRHEKANKR